MLGMLGVVGASGLYHSVRPSAAAAVEPDAVYSIVDFGARSEAGFDNTPFIQAALNEAASTGKPVVIPPGVFEISLQNQASLFIPSGVRITGCGIKSILRLREAPQQRAHMLTNADWKGGDNSCVIESLTLQCGGFGSYTNGQDFRVNGVTLFNARYCTVRSVVVQNGQGYGIWLHDTSDSSVSDCVVEDLGDCLELSGRSERNLIAHNSIVSSGQVPWVGTGIILFGESRLNTVTANAIRGGFGQGITTVSQYGCASECIFSNNSVDVYNAPALELEGDGHLVQGNVLRSHGRPALYCSERVSPARQALISGNSLESLGAHALYLSAATEQLTIQGNLLRSLGSSAIQCAGIAHSLMSNQVDTLESDLPVFETGEGQQCIVQGNVFRGVNGIMNRHMKNILFQGNVYDLKKRKYRGLRNKAFKKKRK